MLIINKTTQKEYTPSSKANAVKWLYDPIQLEYQLNSRIMQDLIDKYGCDEVYLTDSTKVRLEKQQKIKRFDRAVGSHNFLKMVRAEFFERLANPDVEFVRIFNLNHPTLKLVHDREWHKTFQNFDVSYWIS